MLCPRIATKDSYLITTHTESSLHVRHHILQIIELFLQRLDPRGVHLPIGLLKCDSHLQILDLPRHPSILRLQGQNLIHTGGKGWCTDTVHCKYIVSSGAKELIMYQTGTCLAYSKHTRQIQLPYPSLGYCQDIQDMLGHVTTMFQISNCQGYFKYSNKKWSKYAWVACFECFFYNITGHVTTMYQIWIY